MAKRVRSIKIAKGKKSNRLSKREFTRFKGWIMSLFVIVITMVLAPHVYADYEIFWRRSDAGISEPDITSICVIKDAPNVLFASTKGAIYKSVNYGKSWYRVFMLKGSRQNINFIASDPLNTYRIFAATVDGLYISTNGGKDWRRAFKGKDSLQRQVNHIAIDYDNPSLIFIGTKRGLFQSRDGGRSWKAHNIFINKEVYYIGIGKADIYACAIDGLYCAKKSSDLWMRIYIAQSLEQENTDGDSDNGGVDEADKMERLNYICIYKDNVYMGSSKGLFVSKDGVREFKAITDEGLLTKDIKSASPYENGIFAATDKGIFFYDEDSKIWRDKSIGLASLHINAIDLTKKKNLVFVATDKGLYSAELVFKQKPEAVQTAIKSTTPQETKFNIPPDITKEPGIYEIQEAAIEYAEVSPKKIEWMRNAAKNKAWLPTVSAGFDSDTERNLHVDTGGTATPDFYIVGPEDKSWGWSVSASWNLGELIWNDDQTNIDVRSKLPAHTLPHNTILSLFIKI